VSSTRRLGAVALLAGALALPFAIAPSSAGAFTHAQRASFHKAVAVEKRRDRYPGMVVGVWSKGHGSFVTTPGLARIGKHPRGVTPETSFRVGSLTKTFTATLILRLVQEGKLRLGDHLSSFVGGIPNGGQISIRELLHHTSGIPDFPSSLVGPFLFLHPHIQYGPLRLVRRSLVGQQVVTPAPAPFLYSNLNYLLLGVIARRITHHSLHYLYGRLFHHLGLRHTRFRARPRSLPRRMANGYLKDVRRKFDATRYNLSWAWTAGAMISRLDDLKRWARVMATGDGVLNRRLQRQRVTIDPESSYGLGIAGVQVPKGSRKIWFYGHNGAAPGYDAMAMYSPARKITIVVLGNTETVSNLFPNQPKPPDPFLFHIFNRLACVALHPAHASTSCTAV
jgi:D-alanyl-D-alanine carboxypeptidase